ncbi:MAG: hypothetical protein B6A08_16180 [Sorangiineae bacterium NIC37A_2]|nr:MAG: hypothetical protein B6A08_16180 [Sorangiineae bacterium NIC37A_2]
MRYRAEDLAQDLRLIRALRGPRPGTLVRSVVGSQKELAFLGPLFRERSPHASSGAVVVVIDLVHARDLADLGPRKLPRALNDP